MQEDVPLSYAQAVGDRLRDLRRQRGLSLTAVEESSGREFKASVLGAYERGDRVISVLRLQRLADLYKVPVDQVLPRSTADNTAGVVPGRAVPFTKKRPVRIDVVRVAESEALEAQIVRRYVNMIQKQRTDFQPRTLAIRDEDLRALARVFECDDQAMETKLSELGLLA